MATTARRRQANDFAIHEDGPSTEDTEMNTDAAGDEDNGEEEYADEAEVEEQEQEDDEQTQDPEPEPESEQEQEEDDFSEDEAMDEDMRKLQDAFPGFKHKYRLIKRIGEGTFSTVYKAQDLQYEAYDNKWDLDKENEKWTPPPLKRHVDRSSSTLDNPSQLAHASRPRRRPKYVAIKKIYVTSSPQRILNELELLNDLKHCPAVCPLITAFRSTDQVLAILPYFRHSDFRDYFRIMTVTDMAIYLRSLFTALAFTHEQNIIHRDIKPTNFLYDPATKRGVLVDFGLAEREGSDSKPCPCHDEPAIRRNRLRAAYLANGGPHHGFPKNDTRPSRRANRAGTRGFRAPEVLFKCTEQTTKIDIWSAGVILLTILSRRFPFFNSADDVEAMIEIATIFGARRMRQAAQVHGVAFETNIPTIGQTGYSLGKIIMWSLSRDEKRKPFDRQEEMAVDFLTRCLELDPSRRISAEDAIESDFLALGTDEEGSGEEDLDILEVVGLGIDLDAFSTGRDHSASEEVHLQHVSTDQFGSRGTEKFEYAILRTSTPYQYKIDYLQSKQPRPPDNKKTLLVRNMPTDFDKQSYWHDRFTTETAFEWLVPSSVFMPILQPYLDKLQPSAKILHIGFGTSDLQTHLRARGFTDLLNLDFEPLALEHGRRLEKYVFGDVQMRYEVADATQLALAEGFELVIDKSTVDAVSCGGDEAVLQMVEGVRKSLAPGGVWVSLSYSPRRFELEGMPFGVEVAARIPTPKRMGTDPDVFYWCYLLRSKWD